MTLIFQKYSRSILLPKTMQKNTKPMPKISKAIQNNTDKTIQQNTKTIQQNTKTVQNTNTVQKTKTKTIQNSKTIQKNTKPIQNTKTIQKNTKTKTKDLLNLKPGLKEFFFFVINHNIHFNQMSLVKLSQYFHFSYSHVILYLLM